MKIFKAQKKAASSWVPRPQFLDQLLFLSCTTGKYDNAVGLVAWLTRNSMYVYLQTVKLDLLHVRTYV